jgi:copper transport protein
MKSNFRTSRQSCNPFDSMPTGSALDSWTGLADFLARRGNVVSLVCTRCGRLLVFMGGFLVLLLVPSLVFAHAVPRTTLPESNAVLHAPPQEIAIRFSERVEARTSSLQVFDVHGRRLDEGKAAVTPGDPWLYHTALPPVGAGVYTVSWRVMSADDGHVTEGSYVFVVGEKARSLPAADGEVIAVTGWLDALPRWIGMLATVALTGMLTASCVFWRRQLPRVPSPLCILPCLVALLLAGSYTLFARFQRLPVEESGWTGLAFLLSSNIGQLTAAKIGLALLLGGACVGYWCIAKGRRGFWWLALFLTVLLLVSDALVSHSAATVAWRGLTIGAEVVHLCGIALWLGGLGYFATLFWCSTFREQSPAAELAWAMPAFSLLAVGAIGLLTVSGFYLTQLHLGSFGQLLSTSYGRVLLAKLSVVVLMLALGGYHQFIIHPKILTRLSQAAGGAEAVSQRFRRTLRVEALLGLLALLLAAVLGTTSPPSIASTSVAETFRQSQFLDGVQITIDAWPLRPGQNTIRLTVTDRDGHALTDATAALLQLQVAETETAPMGVTLDREAPGIFVSKNVVLGIEGTWRGRVTIQRQGAFDLHDRFELLLTDRSDHGAHTPTSAWIAAEVGVVYVAIMGVTILLLLVGKRRLSRALQRLEASHLGQSSHPYRR